MRAGRSPLPHVGPVSLLNAVVHGSFHRVVWTLSVLCGVSPGPDDAVDVPQWTRRPLAGTAMSGQFWLSRRDGLLPIIFGLVERCCRLGQPVTDHSGCVARREVAVGSEARVIEIEVICSDTIEHRHRVESRHTDIPGLALPSWQEVSAREFHP